MPWKYASSGLVLTLALLTGCSSMSDSSAQAGDTSASTAETEYSRCNSDAAQFAVGKPASQALLDQARAKAGAQTARVLGPNDMVTLEYRSDRLNLNTDRSATVTRVNCG